MGLNANTTEIFTRKFNENNDDDDDDDDNNNNIFAV
jgi:hypothetical protein